MSKGSGTTDQQIPQDTAKPSINPVVGLPDNNISTTLFRFVSVRGPRPPTAESLRIGFISYSDVGSPSQLFTNLASIARNERLSTDQRLTAMRSEVDSFRKTTAFLSDLGQLRASEAQLWDIGEWLTARASSLTQAMVRDYLPDPAKLQLPEDGLSRLWDNLFAHLIAGGGTDLRQRVIESLRADHFLRQYFVGGVIVEEPVLRRLAAATPVLPAEIFPLPRTDMPGNQGPGSTDDTPGSEASGIADTRRQEAANRLQQVQQTLGQVRDAYALQLERAAARQAESLLPPAPTPPAPEPSLSLWLRLACRSQLPPRRPITPPGRVDGGSDIGLLTPDLLASLPDTAKEVLAQHGITTGQRVAFAINKLSVAESALTTAIWGDVSLTRRLYRVGGGLWVREDVDAEFANPANGIGLDPVPVDLIFDLSRCPNPLLGVADLRLVEQELCCYLPGEVAHIENILQGEHKERATRRLRRTEETFTFSTERETEDERDTQTTDRFELQRETSKTITEETSQEAGLTVSGEYGPVKVEASLGYSTSSGSTESDKEALTYAHSVTDRALQRVTEKVRQEQITKVLEEFEETNRHGLDNRGGSAHVVGLYRWVDKLFKARVVNYGKRLTLDFMLPEPGAFHLWAMTKPAASATVTLEEPLDPRSTTTTRLFGQAVTPLFKHTDVTPSNYALWAAAYGATVEPPPPDVRIFSTALGQVVGQPTASSSGLGYATIQPQGQITIDAGYAAKVAFIQLHYNMGQQGWGWAHLMVGRLLFYNKGPWDNFYDSNVLNDETDFVPVSLLGYSTYVAAHIEVEAHLTAAGLEAWQLKTFKAIMDGYTAQKTAYENALAEQQAQRGVDIQGTNPLLNRLIERNELKKSCITWLDRGHEFSANGIGPGPIRRLPPTEDQDRLPHLGGRIASPFHGAGVRLEPDDLPLLPVLLGVPVPLAPALPPERCRPAVPVLPPGGHGPGHRPGSARVRGRRALLPGVRPDLERQRRSYLQRFTLLVDHR